MKAKSTIQKEERRLRRFVEENRGNPDCQIKVTEAYAMATAMQWILTKCDWTPHGIFEM